MNVQVLAAVVGGIAGLATGAVASLVAPWVNWGIEKRRLRLQRRRQLVDDWRNGLAEAEINDIFGTEHYQHLLWYQSFRPHLSKQMKKGDGSDTSRKSGIEYTEIRYRNHARPIVVL